MRVTSVVVGPCPSYLPTNPLLRTRKSRAPANRPEVPLIRSPSVDAAFDRERKPRASAAPPAENQHAPPTPELRSRRLGARDGNQPSVRSLVKNLQPAKIAPKNLGGWRFRRSRLWRWRFRRPRVRDGHGGPCKTPGQRALVVPSSPTPAARTGNSTDCNSRNHSRRHTHKALYQSDGPRSDRGRSRRRPQSRMTKAPNETKIPLTATIPV